MGGGRKSELIPSSVEKIGNLTAQVYEQVKEGIEFSNTRYGNSVPTKSTILIQQSCSKSTTGQPCLILLFSVKC